MNTLYTVIGILCFPVIAVISLIYMAVLGIGILLPIARRVKTSDPVNLCKLTFT